MYHIRTNGQLHAIRAAGIGVVYNDFSPSLGTPQENRLHQATCRHLARANTNVDKYGADDPVSAVAWLERERGAENIAWFRCVTCLGSTESSPSQADAAASATPSSASPPWSVTVEDGAVVAVLPRTIQFRGAGPLPGWMVAATKSLRLCLGELDLAAVPLVATLEGPLPPHADLENVLLYNIGVPARLVRNGVRLRHVPKASTTIRQIYAAASETDIDSAAVGAG